MEDVIEINLTPTTIWIKKGTKRMLDEVGDRKETYDDIIQRLVREHNTKKNHDLNTVSMIKDAGASISSYDTKTRKSRLTIREKEYIDFTYTIPVHPCNPEYMREYSFNIHYLEEKVNYSSKGKRLIEQKAKHYLMIVEKIIQAHFNSFFRITPKHHLNPDWWRKEFKKLGLPEQAYETGIIENLMKIGIVDNENAY